MREPDVVGIDEGDELAAGVAKGEVARDVGAGVLLREQRDLLAVLLDDRARAVGRAVVDDEELEVAVGLREDAVDGARNPALAVVHRQDDGDERPGHYGYFSGFAPSPAPR